MNETTQQALVWLRENHTKPYMLASAALIVAIMGMIAGFGYARTGSPAASVAAAASPEAAPASADTQDSLVATLGDAERDASARTSWAGSIISLGTVPVQPTREGTIVSWLVRIGATVETGQPIAKLSEPPAMPELVTMLAAETKMLAEKRAAAETTRIFVQKNNEQLRSQLAAFERSAQDASTLLSTKEGGPAALNARRAIEQATAALQSMRGELRAFLDQMAAEHTNTITNTHIPALYRPGSLHAGYGTLDLGARNELETNLFSLIQALKDPQALPIAEATRYLASAVRLAHSTVYSEGVEDIRSMMKMDQENFLGMVSEFKDAEAEASMKTTDYEAMSIEAARMLVTDRRMIEEKIAENEKMLGMAEAEVAAAEASYQAVLKGTKGGLYLTAPLSGTISTIEKNAGEFVMPGMPVARITSRSADAKPFVRFRIPGNARPPAAGEQVQVVRPGFPEIVKEAVVTGVGASLDAAGMYMADATFVEKVSWPIDASVRVIAPESAMGVLVPVAAVWWAPGGEPMLWRVSHAGRVYAAKIAVGRTLGSQIEVYEGLKTGDRYLRKQFDGIREDMSIDELVPQAPLPEREEPEREAAEGEHDNMSGM